MLNAEDIAKGALRIEWKDTESQARRVAEYAEDMLAASASPAAGAAVGAPDLLKEIAQRLTVMLMSAKCYIDPSDDDVVIGYRIKTGALHQIIGMLECAGYRVSIPSNLPAEDGRGYVGIEPAKTLSTAPTTGSAPDACERYRVFYTLDHNDRPTIKAEPCETGAWSKEKALAFIAGKPAAPASPAASVLTDEQIMRLAEQHDLSPGGDVTVVCGSELVAFARALLAASTGGEPK